jgi:hypothetical protein
MEKITRKVTLAGLRPIMFDRYSGSMKEQLAPQDKVYRSSMNPKNLILPSVNIQSFLSAQNTESAPQRIIGRGWKAVAKAALTFVEINPMEIPIMQNDIPATIDNIVIDHRKAIIKKGQLSIPSDKERPVLDMPWSINFELTLYKNPDLNENILRRLFDDGGIQIGLGTFRGVFGKFEVTNWE